MQNDIFRIEVVANIGQVRLILDPPNIMEVSLRVNQ